MNNKRNNLIHHVNYKTYLYSKCNNKYELENTEGGNFIKNIRITEQYGANLKEFVGIELMVTCGIPNCTQCEKYLEYILLCMEIHKIIPMLTLIPKHKLFLVLKNKNKNDEDRVITFEYDILK